LTEIPGIQFAAPVPAAAPPEVKVAPRSEPQRITVDAEIQEAMLLEMVQPAYPVAAKITRMTGTVRLKAIINTEGRVAQLQIVEGPPLLAAAARAAVEKWRYRPTILNGAAVEVATNIVVHFRLT
jgi:protein TonB